MPGFSSPQVPIGAPSPTLTNPDMILPHDPSSEESTPSTPRRPHRAPSPPTIETGHSRSGSAPDDRIRAKATMYSPFRNGVLRRHDGSTRLRSNSEKGDRRDQSRFPYQSDEGAPLASSPTMQEQYHGYEERSYAEAASQDYDHVETKDSVYSTPAILEEDENDPHSHAAMTKRAEEILANAKKRLTTMEGNLSRARSTLERRPSSSMSSFSNRNPEPVSLYTISPKGRFPGSFTTSKHRQPNLPSLDESKQGHLRVFSETSVPSSLQTNLPNVKAAGVETVAVNGSGTLETDAASRDRHSEPSRNWFWNGLTRNTSINHAGRHNGLQPLNEDGPPPESFEKPLVQSDAIEPEDTVELSSPTAAAFDAQNPPVPGLTRARSTTQMHELREQMQDLKGKISTLKQRAREDSMKRRSLQSLRTPSPFTAAEQWYVGTPLSDDDQAASGSGLAEGTNALDAGEEQVKHGEERAKDAAQDSRYASPVVEQHIGVANNDAGHLRGMPIEPSLEAEGVEETPQVQVKVVNGYPSKKERLVLVDEPSPVKPQLTSHNTQLIDKPLPSKANLGDNEREVVDEPILMDAEGQEDSLYGDDDYHDTSTSPIIERHEDRPDAFDYEHFMLHSAMGSYSGVGIRRSSSRRKRTSSLSSESSVETTKPRNSIGENPADLSPQGENLANGTSATHGRQNSVDSISTVNTFATAIEGTESSDDVPSEPAPRQKVDFPKNRADRIRPEPRSRNSFRNRKHITSAQKGYPNGTTTKSPPASPPVEKPAPAQVPDLLSYLSSMVPQEGDASAGPLGLGDRDKELVERLVKSLSKLCGHMHTLGPEGSKYEARVFRRKLDAARRILDGEMNGEAF